MDGASSPLLGEYVLVEIPGGIQGNGQVADEAIPGAALPLLSNEVSPQQFGFIRGVSIHAPDSWLLEVYPVVSLSVLAYNGMDDAAKATLLPLSLRHPTPEAFGPPLDFGDRSTPTDSWLSVIPRRVLMPMSRPFKRVDPPLVMPPSLLQRIESYRESLGFIGDKRSDNVPVLEGVDSDAEGADATMRDDLIMLAQGGDPTWVEALKKYLHAEEEERKRMQEARAVRLVQWREGMT